MIMMMLQDTTTPDNMSFLLLGLAVWTVLFGGWLASYIVRWRNQGRELLMLQDLTQSETDS